MDYKLWNQLSGAGKMPTYLNGEIYCRENGQTVRLPYNMTKEYASYNLPKNSYNIDKKGLEYVVNFGKVKSLRSVFSVDGAYYHIRKISQVLPFGERKNMSYQGQLYPYLPVYPGGEGDLLQRLNSNFQVITHIPALKLITSLGMQVIWFDKAVNFWEDGNGDPVYFSKGAGNQKNYGVTEGVDRIFVDPVGFYDKGMVYHAWENDMTFQSPWYFMVKEYKSNNYDMISYPVISQINLKLTKEIGEKAKLAFFVNNIFNNRPLYQNPNTDSYIRRNQTAYFGAEFKFIL
jgi:hypothetical protein